MEQQLTSMTRLPLLVLAAVLFLAFSGAVFYGWVQHGSSIFLAFAESGLSWCL